MTATCEDENTVGSTGSSQASPPRKRKRRTQASPHKTQQCYVPTLPAVKLMKEANSPLPSTQKCRTPAQNLLFTRILATLDVGRKTKTNIRKLFSGNSRRHGAEGNQDCQTILATLRVYRHSTQRRISR